MILPILGYQFKAGQLMFLPIHPRTLRQAQEASSLSLSKMRVICYDFTYYSYILIIYISLLQH